MSGHIRFGGTGTRRRLGMLASTIAVLGLATTSLAVTALPAAAAPPPPTPVLSDAVTTDPLPTVQIDGVAWSQVVVGGTVYVAGDFTTARPAGAAAGVSTTPRASLLAYDLVTGELVAGWAPTLNGPAYAIAASPDGNTIYVGGDFTRVNNVARNRFAVLNRATGALNTAFTGGANAAVRTITASASAVYLGGNFTIVAGADRPRVASFDAATGALRAWRASVQPAQVDSMTLSPDGASLLIGGRFQYINNQVRKGTGAVATSNAALLPWTVGNELFAYGYSAGIQSLTTDGTYVYGSSFAYLGIDDSDANFEGIFAADPATGKVVWVEDCHGDSYSVYPNKGKDRIYMAGHPHQCSNIGGFPEVNPRLSWYGLSFGKEIVGKVQPNTQSGHYSSIEGFSTPELRPFFPTFSTGTFTGMSQAGWNVTGSGDYVLYAGEFPRVNGIGQQGLVRFATRDKAPDAFGPQLTGSTLTPTARSHGRGAISVSWPANWDREEDSLRYDVYRDGTLVHSLDAASRFWDRSRLSFVDTGLADNRQYTYAVRAVDAGGRTVTSPNVSATTVVSAGAALSTYARTILDDTPAEYWRLSDTSGSTQDWTSWDDAGVGAGVVRGVPGAIVGDPNTAATFTGASTSRVYGTRQIVGQHRLSIEAWFRTSSTAGGSIVSFGTTSGTGNSTTNDRKVYMGADGRVTFGVFPAINRTVTSTRAFNDGAWHQVVATLGRGGMTLYVDGAAVASDGSVTFGRFGNGYWRIGGDIVAGWPNAGGQNFIGQIDEVGV